MSNTWGKRWPANRQRIGDGMRGGVASESGDNLLLTGHTSLLADRVEEAGGSGARAVGVSSDASIYTSTGPTGYRRRRSGAQHTPIVGG
jgi:hypothetical protein